MVKIPSHIIFRLTFSKVLFKRGVELVDKSNDIFDISQGLVSVHDALDNFAGAVVSHLNISSKKNFLMDMLSAIEKKETEEKKQDFQLLHKKEIGQLNTIRNNIKHNGIKPNIQQSKFLIIPTEEFLDKYSLYYFNLKWGEISMADLVQNAATKADLKESEDMIEKGDFKGALDKIALAKFREFEEEIMKRDYFEIEEHAKSYIESIQPDMAAADNDGWEGKDIFYPDGSMFWPDQYEKNGLLDDSIDRELLKKVEELSAKVGLNNLKDCEYIYKHGENWGKPNWTKENALFCHDVVLDAIIKKQGRDPGFDEKNITYEHDVQIVNGDLEIKGHDGHGGKITKVLKEGDKYKVILKGYKDGDWELYDQHEQENSIKFLSGSFTEDCLWFFESGDVQKIEVLNSNLVN